MRMGVLGLVDLSKLVFTLNEVTRLTVLGDPSSKGVVLLVMIAGVLLDGVILVYEWCLTIDISKLSNGVILVVATNNNLVIVATILVDEAYHRVMDVDAIKDALLKGGLNI